MIPQDLLYSADHEWLRTSGDDPSADGAVVRVGISDYAQNSLGDIVFVQLPDEGAEVSAGDSVGEVESTKSVSDVVSPVAGTVVAVNPALDEHPELVNSDPYGDGWMFELRLAPDTDLSDLLDAAAYAEQVGES